MFFKASRVNRDSKLYVTAKGAGTTNFRLTTLEENKMRNRENGRAKGRGMTKNKINEWKFIRKIKAKFIKDFCDTRY